MKKIPVFTLLVCVFLVLACNRSAKIPDDFDYGTIKNGIYRNDYFKMQLTVPEKWVVQNKEQTQKIADMGADQIAGGDEKVKSQLKAAEVKTAYLFTVFKEPVGFVTTNFNPSYMVVAENLSQYPTVKTGAQYLGEAKKLLQRAAMGYTFEDELGSVTINGHKFDIMKTKLSAGGFDVQQWYYSTIINKFSLNFIVSWADDEQKKELDKVIESVKFD
jgi:hypothetical protein